MERTKRFMTLLLAVLLALTAIGGAALAEDKPEMRKVSVICRATFSDDWPLDERGKNLCYQEFEKQLAERGIEVEYELIEYASMATTVKTRMAAQVDVPDIISDAWIGITESEILGWAENGLLLNIKEIVDQYDEDGSIFKFYEDHAPGALATNTAADGGVYWFSYLNAANWIEKDGTPMDFHGNSHTTLIRADWLEKAGIEYKKQMTHDELFDALAAFQKADVNDNKMEDEVIAIDITGFGNGIARSFGLSTELLCDVDTETGKVINNLYKPEFADYIAYMNRLYEAGLYDTTALSEGMEDQLVADNKASLCWNYADWSVYESSIGATNDAVYAPFMLVNEDGKSYSSADPIANTYCHYLVTSACKDPEAVVDLFDYIYTDEYATLDIQGLEGISFEYDENGIPQTLFDAKVHPVDWEGTALFNTVGLVAFPAINTGTQVFNRVIRDDFCKLKDEFRVWYQDEGSASSVQEKYGRISIKVALPTTEEMAKIDEVENVLTTYMQELLTDLVLGNRSIDDLPACLEELESLGLTDYLEIMQARRDRFVTAVGAN